MAARSLALLLALAGLAAAGAASAAGLPVVAVFNIEAKRVGLSASSLQTLSDYLSAQLAGSGAFSVVPRDRLKRELTKQKKASYKDCYSQSCQVEIGQELAAQKAVSAQILKLGGKCIVTLSLLDLKRAATDRAATAEGGCSEGALKGAVASAAKRLTAQDVADPVSSSSSSHQAADSTAPAGPSGEPGMTRGPEKAPVTIEEFTDYECPYCHQEHRSLREVLPRFAGKVRTIHRDFPLDNACNPTLTRPMHPMACRAAYYARCAAAQGKFAAMDDAIFAEDDLSEDKLHELAKRVGLNTKLLDSCLASPRTRKAVLADIALGAARGVTGTPTAFVNGERVVGVRDPSWWEDKIRALLK